MPKLKKRPKNHPPRPKSPNYRSGRNQFAAYLTQGERACCSRWSTFSSCWNASGNGSKSSYSLGLVLALALRISCE